jgi:hypothetical protein
MNSFAAIAAAIALVVPVPSAIPWAGSQSVRETPATRSAQPKFGLRRHEPEPFRSFRESYRPAEQDQVRIDQQVIIRIAPSPPSARAEMFATPSTANRPVRFKEKKADRCVPIDGIAGVGTMEPNRLLLFMRDHRVLSAALERACDAEAFYLGFSVEQSADGRLCTGRDTLRARTGARCRLSRISRLVAVKD